jgi:hypothetical protein
MVKTTLSLRKISLTTIVVVVFTVATMTMSSTVFSTSATAPMAFGERIMIDSKQLVTVSTTNGIDQNNNNTIDRNTSSLGITQSPENGLDVGCEGDLICEIFGNNTLVDTNTVENTVENTTTTTTVITSALDALNQTLNQSLTQSLNQSSIPLLPFSDNDFDDMLNNDSGSFNEQDDLDFEMDKWIDRMLNATLGDLQPPLQTSPDLLAVSV